MSETSSNGITVRLPRRLLPVLGAFVLGSGGGLAGGWFGVRPSEAEAAIPVPHAVQQQLADLNAQREAQARALAVLEEQVRSGIAAVRADISDLRGEVKELRRDRRR